LILPTVVFLVSAYLVVWPLMEEPGEGYVFALLFLGAGVIAYTPFVYFRWSPPGMRES
jgi:L-type amino acid transporter 9